MTATATPPGYVWDGAQWVLGAPPAPPAAPPPAPVAPQPVWNGTAWVMPAAPPLGAQPPNMPPPPQESPTANMPKPTLADFHGQKQTGGGPSWKFHNRPVGTTYWGIVSREIGNGDVDYQTNPNPPNEILRQKDGSPKYVIFAPMKMIPSADYPEGMARCGIKGDMAVKINAAMAAVGAPVNADGGYVPEVGAFLQVTVVQHKPLKGMSPMYIYQVDYRRPNDPHSLAKSAEIDAAIAALQNGTLSVAEPPPPPQPVWNGTAWVMPTQGVAPAPAPAPAPPAPPAVPPPAAVTPPPAPPAGPPPPAPAAPPAPPQPIWDGMQWVMPPQNGAPPAAPAAPTQTPDGPGNQQKITQAMWDAMDVNQRALVTQLTGLTGPNA
jgi:hypothetical protein